MGTTSGGAKRGRGYQSTEPAPLTSLLSLGDCKTTASQPSFLVYLPATHAHKAILTLIDTQGQVLHCQEQVLETSLKSSVKRTLVLNLPATEPQTSGATGILRLSFPKSAAPLETGQVYRWQFILVDALDQPLTEGTLAGEIQRIQPDPSLHQRLSQALLSEHPSLYQQAGFHYDALVALDALRRQADSTAIADEQWQAWFSDKGDRHLAEAPIYDW